jgi:release factor glutamine methyltransferase
LNDTVLAAAKRLAAAGIDSARLDARLLWGEARSRAARTKWSSGPFRAANAASTSERPGEAGSVAEEAEAAQIFESLIQRRLGRESVAAITGRKGFWSLELEVGPGVLIPRPDTETLIEESLRLVPDRTAPLRIADLGTGSGAILLAALAEFPNATGIGFESSPQAYRYARANAERLAPGRADIRLADWAMASEGFDLVFSNPPYIPTGDIESLAPEVRAHEPQAALDGGPDGLAAYRALGTLLPAILKPGGHALLEIGFDQAQAMEPLFPGLELIRIAPDLSGIPRCVVLKTGNFLGNQGPIR